MLQSLSLKDYPQEIFNEFDFVIVDECHHISSKSFSKALLKLRATYTLGLSATPERTDGLTYIFQYFLGHDIYKLEENKIKHVEIKPLFYKNACEEEKHLFQIKKIYNGNLNLSAMISNLTLSEERNKFILDKILLIKIEMFWCYLVELNNYNFYVINLKKCILILKAIYILVK